MTRSLATASLITTAFFILAIFSLHILPTEVNPLIHGISFYALSRYGVLLSLALYAVSLSGILLSLALWKTANGTAHRIGLLLLMVWGLATILAAIFPVDSPGATPTLSGRIHNLAGLSFLIFTAALLLIELSRSNKSAPRQITYFLAWLVLAAAVMLFVFNGPLYSLGIGGIIQRLYWLAAVLWLMFKALQLRRQEQSQPA